MDNDGKSDDESDNKGSSIKTIIVTQSFSKQLFFVAIAVFGLMFVYEFVKTYFIPTLSTWESHFITIGFSTVIATLAAYVILKNRNKLLEEVTENRDNYKLALKKMTLSEKKLQEVFDNANDMISLNMLEDDGLPGNFIEINEMGTARLGYSKDEFLKMTPLDIIAPDERSKIPKNALKLSEKGYSEFEIIHMAKDGKRIPVEVNNHIFELDKKKVVIAVSRDITERKQAEEILKNNEQKYRKIFDNVQDVFYQTDIEGNIIEISPSIERYSGYKREEVIGKTVDMFYFDSEDRSHLLKEIQEKGEVSDYELKLKTKNEGLVYTSNNAHFLLDSNKKPIGIEGSLRDINDRKKMEGEVKKSLEEKEMLLKEIHHRVKNNLMIIASLLNIQSRYIKDSESQEIFKESQNRARSMAIIHERLYQSVDLKRIDFGDYVCTLANELFHAYTDDSGRIKLEINLEAIFVDINIAIPLGLIINELITNSLKHAFPDDRSGEISIDFHQKEDSLELSVKDDGIGFPEDLDYRSTSSLGLQLVNNLTEQIDGEVKLDGIDGTCFKITFKN